jgi:hypothetical protein
VLEVKTKGIYIMMINVPCTRLSGLQEEPSQYKEMSHHLWDRNQQENKKKVNRCNHLIIGGKWTSEALEEAMDVIENKTTSLRKTNRH